MVGNRSVRCIRYCRGMRPRKNRIVGMVATPKGVEKMRKIEYSVIFTACVIRVYRGPTEMPYVDDGTGRNQLRAQTVGECVGAAVIQGAMLAQGIIDGLRVIK